MADLPEPTGFYIGATFYPYLVLPRIGQLPPKGQTCGAGSLSAPERALGEPARKRPRAAEPTARASGVPPPNSSTGKALLLLKERGHKKGDKERDEIAKSLRSDASASELGEAAMAIEHRRLLESPQYATAWRSYAAFCVGRREEPEPPTAAKVLGWCTWYVAERGNQAAGLSGIVTNLKGHRRGTAAAWMPLADEERVRAACKTLEKLFPYTVTPALPITLEVITPVLAFLRGRRQHGLYEKQLCALILLAHGGFLRGIEMVEGRLLWEDIEYTEPSVLTGRGGMSVQLVRRKMEQKKHDPRSCGTMIVARADVDLDPVAAMRAFSAEAKLNPKDPVFQERDPATGAVTRAEGFRYSELTRTLRVIFDLAQIPNADLYTGRGFRAGGHSDAYRESGGDFQLVGMLGGWKSAKAQELYLRLHVLGFQHLSEVFG